jgi:ubiquinone/menaquinone biosynthesis C-methylase UbiE
MSSAVHDEFGKIAAIYEKSAGGATRLVATHLAGLIDLDPATMHTIKIFDNACGTGIMIDEILALPSVASNEALRHRLEFTAADEANSMIEVLKHKVADGKWAIPAANLTTHALAAEDLDVLSDGEFDYSFTNFGFLFFKDPEKAARHVYRTLKPGGKAFVTTWKSLPYIDAVQRAALSVRPGYPEPVIPLDPAWLDPVHVEDVFKRAGFDYVRVYEQPSRYSGDSVVDVSNTFMGFSRGFLKGKQGWSDEELDALSTALATEIEGLGDALEVTNTTTAIKTVALVAVLTK